MGQGFFELEKGDESGAPNFGSRRDWRVFIIFCFEGGCYEGAAVK